ncbi:MAG: 30S ribosomal protein S20 [Bacteroidia bacterium]|nr:MAG: 30S ribosomal protein S20 [Bacteroidia bacterium]
MPNLKSAIKRTRQIEKRRLHNRYYAKSTRTAIKKFKAITTKAEALKQLPSVVSMLDKLAKRNIIHKNKAARLKSQLYTFANQLN